jgi:hypothetical protein
MARRRAKKEPCISTAVDRRKRRPTPQVRNCITGPLRVMIAIWRFPRWQRDAPSLHRILLTLSSYSPSPFTVSVSRA